MNEDTIETPEEQIITLKADLRIANLEIDKLRDELAKLRLDYDWADSSRIAANSRCDGLREAIEILADCLRK